MALKNWWQQLTDSRAPQGRSSVGLMMDAGIDFPVEVVRTRRKKTVAIKIIEGRVKVMAPKRLPQKCIDEFIIRKASWIAEKLRIQSEFVPVKPREYVSGESFSYLGKSYLLKLTDSEVREIKLRHGQFVLGVDKNLAAEQRALFVKAELARWYQAHAELKLLKKTAHYAVIVGVEPRSVIVKSYKARWGSCSSHGDISFNWKLIMAPDHIVDYVVVHELCHMHQHNHSRQFWQCVEAVMPDYRECRQWLKDNEKTLDI